MASTKQPARRVGRPRTSGRELTREPHEEIIFQASKLFAQKGFASTTTREIAEASGLRQSSLFHYFATKEDVLVAVAERLHAKPLGLLERAELEGGPPAVKLFRLTYGETHLACVDLLLFRAVLESSVSLVAARFRQYHADEKRHRTGVSAIIDAGKEEGEFVDEPTFLAFMRYAGMINWMFKWYRPDGDMPPTNIAYHFARGYVRSLLADPHTLDDVELRATELGLPLAAPTLK